MTDALPIDYPARIRRLRAGLGLSQAQLGQRLGVSKASVLRWEQGQARPSALAWRRIEDEETGGTSEPTVAGRAAISSEPATTAGLPVPLTSFIGRGRELGELAALAETTRLLTLAGTGGAGKTRLALELAGRLAPGYPDGVLFVELGTLADPALVPQAVAAQLGVRDMSNRSLLDSLIERLRSQRVLLVLDNCEHLLTACGALVEALLRACLDLHVLATSREPLGVTGEQIWHLQPLTLPEVAGAATTANLLHSEAVQLFLARAQLQQPAFALTETNAAAVAQVCARLDGLPLALELAAAWVNVLAVEQIAARLEDRFRLLVARQQAPVSRHQTLRAAVDWSYDLLTAPQQRLFRVLATFAGSFDLDALLAVGAAPNDDGAEPDLLSGLRRLVDASLVVKQESDAGARYRLLETLRAYGRERLQAAGESEAALQRHAEYYLVLATGIEPELVGAEQAGALDRVERELDDLRATLRWLDERGEVAATLRLAVVLWRYWGIRGSPSEGRNWLTRLLAHERGIPRDLRANGLRAAGDLAWKQSDTAVAQRCFTESLALYRDLGDQRGIGWVLNGLGIVAHVQGKFAAARASYEECCAAQQALVQTAGSRQRPRQRAQDLFTLGNALNNLGLVISRMGDYETARARFEECLAVRRELGDQVGIASSNSNLGLLLAELGDLNRARGYFEEALTRFQALGDRRNIASAFNNLGLVARLQGALEIARTHSTAAHRGYEEVGARGGVANALTTLALVASDLDEPARAAQLLEEALSIRATIANPMELAEGLEAAIELLVKQDQHDRAAHLVGAASALRAAHDTPLPAFLQGRLDALLTEPHDALGDGGYNTAVAAGAELSAGEAATNARAWIQEGAAAAKPVHRQPDPLPVGGRAQQHLEPGRSASGIEALTERELEVLRTLATGLSNKEIARTLHLSVRTVERHVTNIYAKIGARGRTDATGYGLRHGILSDPPLTTRDT